jgi:hypothetical protein
MLQLDQKYTGNSPQDNFTITEEDALFATRKKIFNQELWKNCKLGSLPIGNNLIIITEDW